MGYRDGLASLSAAHMVAFGEAIIYTPADSSVSAFAGVADFGIEPELIDELQSHIVADRVKCRVEHEMLTDAGLLEPTPVISQQPGDTITRKDMNGSNEVWAVIGVKREETPSWVLDLEKDIRIVP